MSTLIGSVRESLSKGILPALSHHRGYLKSGYTQHQKIHKYHFEVPRQERSQVLRSSGVAMTSEAIGVRVNQSPLSLVSFRPVD